MPMRQPGASWPVQGWWNWDLDTLGRPPSFSSPHFEPSHLSIFSDQLQWPCFYFSSYPAPWFGRNLLAIGVTPGELVRGFLLSSGHCPLSIRIFWHSRFWKIVSSFMIHRETSIFVLLLCNSFRVTVVSIFQFTKPFLQILICRESRENIPSRWFQKGMFTEDCISHSHIGIGISTKRYFVQAEV